MFGFHLTKGADHEHCCQRQVEMAWQQGLSAPFGSPLSAPHASAAEAQRDSYAASSSWGSPSKGQPPLPATLRRFTQRFAQASICARRWYDRHTDSRKQRCTWRPAQQLNHRLSCALTPRSWPLATRSAAKAEVVHRWSATGCRGHRWSTSLIPRHSIECPVGTIGEIWVHGDNVALGY